MASRNLYAEKILMSDTNLWDKGTIKEICKSCQKFVEIYNHICTGLDNTVVYIMHTAQIFGYFHYIIQNTASYIDTFISRCRKEIRTDKLFYRSMYATCKKPGRRLDSLLPTRISTTSCPLLNNTFSKVIAWVR